KVNYGTFGYAGCRLDLFTIVAHFLNNIERTRNKVNLPALELVAPELRISINNRSVDKVWHRHGGRCESVNRNEYFPAFLDFGPGMWILLDHRLRRMISRVRGIINFKAKRFLCQLSFNLGYRFPFNIRYGNRLAMIGRVWKVNVKIKDGEK